MLRVQLDANNDLPEGGPKLVTGVDSVATALQAVFGTQQGEWAFDFTFGCPWRDAILLKFFDPGTTRSIMARITNGLVPEIEPVIGSQIEIDTTSQAANRQVNITINDVRVNGQQLTLALTTTTATVPVF